MTKIKIQWHEWPITPADGGDLGHGVHFHDIHLPRGKDLVAFIEFSDGFGWLHGDPVVVTGYHVKPNKTTTARVLAAMKSRIEIMVNNREAMAEMISRRISACSNS